MDEQDRGIRLEPPLPQDAQHKGLSPVVAPGVQFASSLRPQFRFHRVIAWVTLGLIAGVMFGSALAVLAH